MDALILTKVLALFGLLGLVVVFGLLPMRLTAAFSSRDGAGRRSGASRVLRLMNCFAGGVFLATCLMDLLPTVQVQFVELFEKTDMQMDYPIAELVITMGFLLVLAVEQTVLGCKETRPETPKLQLASLVDVDTTSEAEDDSTDYAKTTFSARLRSFSLLIALSLHSLFEGLAIGLRNDSSGVVRLFTAVAIHKCVLAFSLGLKLVQSNMGKWGVLTSCLCFAVTSPLGVGLGIIFQTVASEFTSIVTTAVLQAIATGTLLYITFLEVLAKEINTFGDRFWKVVSVTIGVVSMAGLVIISG